LNLSAFRYRGRDRGGQAVTGQVQAADEKQAEIQVRELGLTRVVISRVRLKGKEAPWRLELRRRLQEYFSFLFYRVNFRELSLWARSVQFTFKAGMNPYQALHTIGEGCTNPTLAKVSLLMAECALQGQPLAPTMAEFPWVFPPYVRSLVQVGEESGNLEVTFQRLADFFEHMHELTLLHKRMTFYPKLLVAAFFLITNAPVLVVPYAGLPAGFTSYLLLIWRSIMPLLIVLGGGYLVARALGQVNAVQAAWDAFKIRIPYIGPAFYKSSLARWGSALSLMVDSGVPIHRAVISSAPALGNLALERGLLEHTDKLLQGRLLSEVLRESGRFPRELVEIVSIGEQSGNAAASLERVAQFYEQESRTGQKQLVSGTAIAFYAIIAFTIARYVVLFWLSYASGITGSPGPTP